MALFSNFSSPGANGRLTGMSRFTELLDRDFKRYFLVNLLTVIASLPLIAGITYAVLSSSVLILIPSCIIGGCLFGPALSGMYDCIIRSLRDAPGKWFDNYKLAMKQNFKSSILPGILVSLLLGSYIFTAAIFVWKQSIPSIGTILVLVAGLLILSMIITVYWPQLVLFKQSQSQRLINCVLFIARYLWKVLGCSVLQIAYWLVIILFLPWSVLVLPLVGFWFILLVVNFLLYSSFNEAFSIEDSIAEAFPDQVPYYETDAEWLARKQRENNSSPNEE